MASQIPVTVHVQLKQSELYWALVVVTVRRLPKFTWTWGIMGFLFLALYTISWLRPRPGIEWYENLQKSKPLLWVFAFPLFLIFVVPLMTAKKLSSDKRNAQGVKYQFSETGVETETSVGRADLKWTAFMDVLETRSNFFLFVTQNQPHIIPKRCLATPDEVRSLRELLRSNFPKYGFRSE